MFVTNPDGTMGGLRSRSGVSDAIGKGEETRDYSNIRAPVLAIFEFPITLGKLPHPNARLPENAEEQGAVDAFNRAIAAWVRRWMDNPRRGVPGARFVDLPGAGHYLFLSRQSEVLEEIRGFVAGV